MQGFQPGCLQGTQTIGRASNVYWCGQVPQKSSLRGTGPPATYLAFQLVYELLEAVDLQPPLLLGL